jgi:glyoxylase-like metal-dependent hydrolase (beta-lactamase superfamily II)
MNIPEITRRESLFGAIALAVAPLLSRRALAQASSYGFTQGEFQVTVLSDGFISIPAEIMVSGVAPEERAAILSRLDAPNGLVRGKANIPLIRKGAELVLVDIGAGHKYQPSDGALSDNLLAAGVDPNAVTKVVFTHAHPDHIWATLGPNGRLRFPNAVYHVGGAEWDFWMDPNYQATMPAALHGFAKGAQRDLDAIKDRTVRLKPGDEVIGGLRVLDTAGHTPGHLSLEMSGGEGLLISADVAVNEIVSFEHPDWSFGYDTLPEVAIRNRLRLLDRAASDKTKLLGYHWAYPGIGFVERKETAFRFVSAA